ncbi:unnamed protein product [Diamesa serratosioi]
MSDGRRVPPNVYIEPVHTNGMVIYGYNGPNTGQQYAPRPYQHNTNYSRYYSTPPPPPGDNPLRYKPTIAEYYAKYYTPHALRPQSTMNNNNNN